MTNLGLLIKNNFNLFLGRLQGKKQRKSVLSATILVGLGVVALIFLYTLQTIEMFKGLGVLFGGKLCMFHAITTSLSVMVIIGIMRTSDKKSSDSDLLLSLPIKKRDIVLAKTLNKYIFDFFFILLLFVPYVVVYQVMIEVNYHMIVKSLILSFLFPFLSVGLTYVFNAIISKVFNRTRFGGLLKSISMVLIFVVVLGLLLIKTSTYGLITTLDGYFEERPISNMLLNFLFRTNTIEWILTFLLCLVPFVVGVVLYSINFGKQTSSYVGNVKKLNFKANQSPLKLLIKKELFHYGNSTPYIVNTIIGPIIILALGIFLAVTGQDGITKLIGVPVPKILLVGIIVLAFSGMSATCVITASSISLEGKNWWIVKSSPIDAKKLVLSKILLNIIIVEPFLIVSSILILFSMHLTLIEFLAILLLPTLHALIMSVSGVLFNLWVPNFEWEDETKVIKQGLAVLLTMIFGALLTVLIYFLYKWTKTLQLSLILLVMIGAYSLILVILNLILFSTCEKRVRDI